MARYRAGGRIPGRRQHRVHFAGCDRRALAFAISVGTLVVSAAIAYRYRRHVQTLAFAGSLALAGLALGGLTIHELSSKHVTHSLAVTDNQCESYLAPAT